MIHNNEVLDKTIGAAAGFTARYADLEIYIIQNVYGKIMIYVDTDKRKILDEIGKKMRDMLECVLKPLYVNCKSQFVEDLVQMREA